MFSEGLSEGLETPGGGGLSLGGAAAGLASRWGCRELPRGSAQDSAAAGGLWGALGHSSIREGAPRCLLWEPTGGGGNASVGVQVGPAEVGRTRMTQRSMVRARVCGVCLFMCCVRGVRSNVCCVCLCV